MTEDKVVMIPVRTSTRNRLRKRGEIKKTYDSVITEILDRTEKENKATSVVKPVISKSVFSGDEVIIVSDDQDDYNDQQRQEERDQ